MSGRSAAAILACLLLATAARGDDWENPVFDEADAAVAAGVAVLEAEAPEDPDPRRLFPLFTLSSLERPDDPRFADIRRRVTDGFLVTLPSYLEDDDKARETLESFLADVGDEKSRVGETLERFSFPSLRGLVYLRLVDTVADLQDPDQGPVEPGAVIGGTTYYCRYVVLPLSYITPEDLEELDKAAGNPEIDVQKTLREWEQQSYRSLLSTLRHELVHVWSHTSLGAPRYRDVDSNPIWFREGSATFFSGEPYSGKSKSYQGYYDLFSYLVESRGVSPLRSFFARILGGSSVAESLAETYEIRDDGELRTLARRWHDRQATITALLAVGFVILVLVTLLVRRSPAVGSLQIWLGLVLGYLTFSGFCDGSLATYGATAVLILKVGFGAAALFFARRGYLRLKRFFGGTAAPPAQPA